MAVPSTMLDGVHVLLVEDEAAAGLDRNLCPPAPLAWPGRPDPSVPLHHPELGDVARRPRYAGLEALKLQAKVKGLSTDGIVAAPPAAAAQEASLAQPLRDHGYVEGE